jgi:hypothetical protein
VRRRLRAIRRQLHGVLDRHALRVESPRKQRRQALQPVQVVSFKPREPLLDRHRCQIRGAFEQVEPEAG